MDRYVKRSRNAAGTATASAKRPKTDQWGTAGDPSSICIWNCNGLTVRLGNTSERNDFITFVRQHEPDVICLSEVRCAARADNSSAKKNDGGKRYRGEFKDAIGSDGRSDGAAVMKLLKEPGLEHYESYFSLADWKYAGTGVLMNRQKLAKPLSVRYSIDLQAKDNEHDANGRVMCIEFASFCLLHTYCPNNGWAESHFQRRQEWDDAVKEFVTSFSSSGKSIVWAGDLNVAPLDFDLSHPSHYKRQVLKEKGKPPVAPANVGQPGCTPAERERFEAILEAGGLIDLYRFLHPEPPLDSKGKVDIMQPIFSWRGYRAGKHSGRGMRIDHFIGTKNLTDRVESVTIYGQGDRSGFMGSDHCPMVLKISSTETKGKTS